MCCCCPSIGAGGFISADGSVFFVCGSNPDPVGSRAHGRPNGSCGAITVPAARLRPLSCTQRSPFSWSTPMSAPAMTANAFAYADRPKSTRNWRSRLRRRSPMWWPWQWRRCCRAAPDPVRPWCSARPTSWCCLCWIARDWRVFEESKQKKN